jgi:hypothetical protein
MMKKDSDMITEESSNPDFSLETRGKTNLIKPTSE